MDVDRRIAAVIRARGEDVAIDGEPARMILSASTAVDETGPAVVRHRVTTGTTDKAVKEGDLVERKSDGTSWNVERVIARGRGGASARLRSA